MIFICMYILTSLTYQGSSAGFLLYSLPSLGYIYKADIKPEYGLVGKPSLIVTTAHTPEAITYDSVSQQIFWSDTGHGEIFTAFINGSHVKSIVNNVIKPVSLAVDDAARNLYWADNRRGRIEVSRLDGTYRKVLASTGKPTGLVLDINTREMYWSSFKFRQMKIERASMDGTNRKVIVSEYSYNKPTGLAIDCVHRILYWAEKNSDEIYYIDLNKPSVTHYIKTTSFHPYRLAYLGERLYWTDRGTNNQYGEITSLNATSKTDIKILLTNIDRPKDIYGYDEHRHRYGKTNCSKSNGGCDHLCLQSPKHDTCVCCNGMTLKPDGKTCYFKEFLLVVDDKLNKVFYKSLDDLTHRKSAIPLGHTGGINTVDFDPLEHRIYWTDDYGEISRALLNGSLREKVVGGDNMYPSGHAIDIVGRNLYWYDSRNNTIGVSKLNGSYQKTLLTLSRETLAMALDSKQGYIYWGHNYYGGEMRIKRSQMNGANQEDILSWKSILHSSYLTMALAVDSANHRLYFHDGYELAYTDTSPITGIVHTLSLSLHYSPHGLAVKEEYIYWGSFKAVYRANTSSINDEKRVVSGVQPIDLHVYHNNSDTPDDFHPCAEYNGWCTHLCLIKPGGYSCVCPTGSQKCHTTPVIPSSLSFSHSKSFLATHPFSSQPLVTSSSSLLLSSFQILSSTPTSVDSNSFLTVFTSFPTTSSPQLSSPPLSSLLLSSPPLSSLPLSSPPLSSLLLSSPPLSSPPLSSIPLSSPPLSSLLLSSPPLSSIPLYSPPLSSLLLSSPPVSSPPLSSLPLSSHPLSSLPLSSLLLSSPLLSSLPLSSPPLSSLLMSSPPLSSPPLSSIPLSSPPLSSLLLSSHPLSSTPLETSYPYPPSSWSTRNQLSSRASSVSSLLSSPSYLSSSPLLSQPPTQATSSHSLYFLSSPTFSISSSLFPSPSLTPNLSSSPYRSSSPSSFSLAFQKSLSSYFHTVPFSTSSLKPSPKLTSHPTIASLPASSSSHQSLSRSSPSPSAVPSCSAGFYYRDCCIHIGDNNVSLQLKMNGKVWSESEFKLAVSQGSTKYCSNESCTTLLRSSVLAKRAAQLNVVFNESDVFVVKDPTDVSPSETLWIQVAMVNPLKPVEPAAKVITKSNLCKLFVNAKRQIEKYLEGPKIVKIDPFCGGLGLGGADKGKQRSNGTSRGTQSVIIAMSVLGSILLLLVLVYLVVRYIRRKPLYGRRQTSGPHHFSFNNQGYLQDDSVYDVIDPTFTTPVSDNSSENTRYQSLHNNVLRDYQHLEPTTRHPYRSRDKRDKPHEERFHDYASVGPSVNASSSQQGRVLEGGYDHLQRGQDISYDNNNVANSDNYDHLQRFRRCQNTYDNADNIRNDDDNVASDHPKRPRRSRDNIYDNNEITKGEVDERDHSVYDHLPRSSRSSDPVYTNADNNTSVRYDHLQRGFPSSVPKDLFTCDSPRINDVINDQDRPVLHIDGTDDREETII